MINRLHTFWRTVVRRHASPAGGLAALLLVGALVLLAAPSGGAVPQHVTAHGATTPTTNGLRTVSQHLVQQSGSTPGATATPTDTPPAGSTPTATTPGTATTTPTPSATDTPTPIPPTPTATPTATPLPAWHVLTTFSGAAPANLGTINPAYPWRLTYTCVYPGVTRNFLTPYPRDGSTDYPVALCDAGDRSGVVSDGEGWPAPAGSYPLSVIPSDPSAGVPAWTLTVEVWY